MILPHVGDLDEWNEETEWEWGSPITMHVPGWGWVVTHPFSTRALHVGAVDRQHGLVVAVYKNVALTERKALFVLDGGHVKKQSFSDTRHFMPRGFAFDYWQAHDDPAIPKSQ